MVVIVVAGHQGVRPHVWTTGIPAPALLPAGAHPHRCRRLCEWALGALALSVCLCGVGVCVGVLCV